jgi:hypothetical protein
MFCNPPLPAHPSLLTSLLHPCPVAQDIPPVYAPFFPSLQREQWFVILSEETTSSVVAYKEVKDLKPSVSGRAPSRAHSVIRT